MLNIKRTFIQRMSRRTEKRTESFSKKKQWKVKEKMMYEKFDKFIKNTKTVIYDTSALGLLMIEHKIVICLFKKYIIKSKKQWLENENYLFSEFLQRVRALKS